MTKKIHKQIYKKFPNGSTLNTTLCGRMSNHTKDGYCNVADKDTSITCKLCIQKIGTQFK